MVNRRMVSLNHAVDAVETDEDRIQLTGEVFTPPKLVCEMIAKLPKSCWRRGKTVLDNSCGTGNMLVWVLLKKISLGHDPLHALQSIYGVELMPDNVNMCRLRLLRAVSLFTTVTEEAVTAVLTNVVCADALKYRYEFDSKPDPRTVQRWLKLVEFTPDPKLEPRRSTDNRNFFDEI